MEDIDLFEESMELEANDLKSEGFQDNTAIF